MGGTPLNETFTVEDGMLVRRVVPARGTPYEHRCTLEGLSAIAHAVDELGDHPFTMEELREKAGITFTQAAVAVAFIKERGLAVPVHGRKHTRSAPDVHLDVLIEYHALVWQQQHPPPGEPT